MQTDTAPGGVCSHRQSKGYASDPISKVSLSWQGGRRAFTVSSPGHADSPASSTAKCAGAVLGDDRKYIPGHCRLPHGIGACAFCLHSFCRALAHGREDPQQEEAFQGEVPLA